MDAPATSSKSAFVPGTTAAGAIRWGRLSNLDLLTRINQIVVRFQVLVTHVLVDLLMFGMVRIAADRSPRPFENLRVFKCCLDLERVEVGSPDPLHHVKVLGMMKWLMTVSATAHG